MHRSKVSSISGIVLLIPLMILLVTPSLAGPDRTVGVQVGDWAEYVVTCEGNSTEMMAAYLVNVTGMRGNVVSISGTNVTLQGTTYYENGPSTVETGWIDVETGDVKVNSTFPGILIAANLNQDDRVYTSDQAVFGEGTINETVVREYLGIMVEANHFIINITVPPNPFMNMTLIYSWYWYRTTGLLAEMNFYYMIETSAFFPTESSILESSSNMTWSEINISIVDIVPEFPSVLILPLLMILTLVAVTLRKKGTAIQIIKQQK